MRKILTILLLFVTLSATADEKGLKRLETISRHYSAMGSYAVSFVLQAGDGVQSGTMLVDGENSYMKVANTEVFIVGPLRYEVRGDVKEIVIDRADAYEKELLNSLSGFTHIAADYAIEECEIDGHIAIRLTPKQQGETIYIITGADGASIAKLQYGTGANQVVVRVEQSKKNSEALPIFSKERYKGFELIDFR